MLYGKLCHHSIDQSVHHGIDALVLTVLVLCLPGRMLILFALFLLIALFLLLFFLILVDLLAFFVLFLSEIFQVGLVVVSMYSCEVPFRASWPRVSAKALP